MQAAQSRLRLMDFNLDEQIAVEEIPLPTVFGVAQAKHEYAGGTGSRLHVVIGTD